MTKSSQHREDSIRVRLHNLESRISRLEKTTIEAIELGAKVNDGVTAKLEEMEKLLVGVRMQAEKTVSVIETYQAATTMPEGSA